MKVEGWKAIPGWLARGMLMGIADMVPGVSGGTMALITGIYGRFIDALAAADMQFLRFLFKGELRLAWQHIDANFLLTLFSGILLALFAMSHVVGWFLAYQPVLLWGFFLGLLSAASVNLLHDVMWSVKAVIALVLGILLALVTVFAGSAAMAPIPVWFFFGGMIAISAMILPGISGSLILLLLGLYGPAVEAIRQFDLSVILYIGGGCAVGILVFSKFLNWLMATHRLIAMAALTGVVLGAMPRLWPWQGDLNTGGTLTLRLPDSLNDLFMGIMATLCGVIVYAVIKWLARGTVKSQ